MFGINLIWIIVAAVIILFVIIAAMCYVKAPSSTAYLLSGWKKEPRVLNGSGGVKIPILERLDKVYLGQLTVDVKTEKSVPTNDFINVTVDAVAKVQVTPTAEGIRLAAKNFLNMTPAQIAAQLQDNLQGNLRELIGTMDLKTLNIDRDGFSNKVQEKAAPDMDKLGIRIIAFNIQNIKDEQGLIENLGADNTWKIRKDAAITKSEAERDIEKARAENENQANQARVESQKAIAKQNADLAVEQADQKKRADTQQAIADAAYDIQKQEQQKVINEKTVAAATAKVEKEQELTQQKIAVRENEANAEKRTTEINALAQKAKTVTDAEAAKSQKELDAQAKLEQDKRAAEARRYEMEQEAAGIKAKADAKRYEMEQEAAGIKAKGEAEGAATEAKLVGEANGMREKAEAYKQYNDAAMASMALEIVPDVARALGEQVAAIKGINIYSSGQGGAGIAGITSTLPTMFAQVFDTMKSATGIDIPGKIMGGQKQIPSVGDKKTDSNPNPTGKKD
jgi:flotillin